MPKTRKMLNDWDAPYIQSLRRLIETQSKETLANWAITYCEERLLPLWERDYPDDLRPQQALKAAREWLSGTIKLPQAKKEILACHGAARDAEGNPVALLCRTLGVSESGYYKFLRSKSKPDKHANLLAQIYELIQEDEENANYGVRRIYDYLRLNRD
ncbi:putative immunity protein, partial [Acetobacterium sp. MES1]|uniref:putative immunity protein n=1 Tax=Acetobacterium sp. MES1 TaxID=1899015 RepID=UPI00339007D4